MVKNINRRGFLKLAGLLPMVYFAPRSLLGNDSSTPGDVPNILIVVFDALSALHTPFNGYPRNTMPFLSELAKHASVYHNHYSGGNFTTPGTATLLTGTYPWTNRGFKKGYIVDSSFENRNLFALFEDYYRISYSHNPLVNTLQNQFMKHLDLLKPRRELSFGIGNWIGQFLKNDDEVFTLSWDRALNKADDGYSYSLLFSDLYESLKKLFLTQFGTFPRGLPEISEESFFLLEKAIDWTASELKKSATPFLGYFHYLPPHEPYNTRQEFVDVFAKDGFYQPSSPPLYWGDPYQLENVQLRMRRKYDEFILYSDAEFNRLYTNLQESGILDNTILIFTSDHGEIFDRGTIGHMTPYIYQPLVKIPLLVFMPGQTERRDIYETTSATDILPTLLHLTGKPIPSWIEGEILPPFNPNPPVEERSVFSLEAKDSNLTGPLSPSTAMIVKGDFKFSRYYGYDPNPDFEELFDIANDPEELNQLIDERSDIAKLLRSELLERMTEANHTYNSEAAQE